MARLGTFRRLLAVAVLAPGFLQPEAPLTRNGFLGVPGPHITVRRGRSIVQIPVERASVRTIVPVTAEIRDLFRLGTSTNRTKSVCG